ncbi:non-ribosomal peptide synthase/polyketide synthase [Chitinophaga niastensis]|uniref:non-ribosomal peptide synthetase n=1 Tax=Chitinophaga niastensis TaxID=536980 RepID=UPI003CCC36AB
MVQQEVEELKNKLFAQLPDTALIEDIFPMSDIQSGMVYASLLNPEKSVYHDQMGHLLDKNLNIPVLEKALLLMVRKHAILRTAFNLELMTDGVQVVYKSIPVRIDHFNLPTVNNIEAKEILEAYLEKERAIPFRLDEAPLWRAAAFTLKDCTVFIFQCHHAIIDGWSDASFNTELNNLYLKLKVQPNQPLLPLLNCTYKDYVIENIAEKKSPVNRSFWKDEMHEYKRLNIFSREAADLRLVKKYSISYLNDLKQRTEADGLSLKGLLLGAFIYSLSVLNYEDELTLGLVSNSRPLKEDGEKVLGCFLNTIPFRHKADPRVHTWKSYFEQIEQKLIALKKRDRVSLVEITSIAGEQFSEENPFFDVLFNFVNFHVYNTMEEGLPAVQDEALKNVLSHGAVNTWLNCNVNITNNIFIITFSLRRQLKSGRTLDDLYGYFDAVLHQYLNHYEAPVNADIIIPAPELKQLLFSFNETAHFYPADKTITALFSSHAAKNPDAIAVTAGDGSLTYQQLDEQSGQLANCLLDRGIRKEMMVPVCLERSAAMITAILGVLKAGGAYVPVDPEAPVERIAYMLADTAAEIVITSGDLISKLQAVGNLKNIIDLNNDTLSLYEKTSPDITLSAQQLAYVIYTSGSTGQPRGVQAMHGPVVNLIFNQSKVYDIKSDERILLLSNYIFDAAVEQMFFALLNGVTLVIVPKNILFDNVLFEQFLIDQRITHLEATPSFLANINPGTYGGLKRVISGGEACRRSMAAKWNKQVDFYNIYGPTEATISSLCYHFDAENNDNTEVLPIGKPLANTRVYILDKKGNPLPVGVTGELYIAGIGVTRGYLNHPELTTEKFTDDTFCNTPGEKMYRTGDMGRWLPDGNIEFQNRIDDQAKIRGFRIEPGEIENVLLQCDAVNETVVLNKPDISGAGRLVAYIVPQGEFNKTAITDFLKQRVPEYMIPALLIPLEKIPLTVNGKIDRKALPDPDTTLLLSNVYIAPRSETEQLLTNAWQELLGVARVGVRDNIFELGGHSLLFMRLISFLRKKLDMEIPIKALFLYPDVEGFAAYLQQQRADPQLPAIKTGRRPADIPLSYSQERLWFIDQLEGSMQYNIPVALRLKGKLYPEGLSFALQTIVNRHEVLRTVIRQSAEDGTAYQYILDKDKWQLHIVNNLSYRESEDMLQDYVKAFFAAPFDLSAGYMIQAELLILGEEDHLLIVKLHHIAADAWSVGIIVNELSELYAAYIAARPANLLPLPVQYAEYAIWQRTYLSGSLLEKKLAYWKDKLSGVTVLELPVNYNKAAVQNIAGGMVSYHINHHLTQRLKQLSHQQGTTLFMTLLAAFKVLLYRYSNQRDICVGCSASARPQQEVEGLVGFFVNTLALRSILDTRQSFIALLEEIKKTTLDAYEHQDVPFEKIVEAVVKDREINRSPLFQVMFVMQQKAITGELSLGDLVLTTEETDQATAKFDITLSVIEQDEILNVNILYRSSLFDEPFIARMGAHFEQLLQSVVDDPFKNIGVLQLLTADEEQQLLTDFNRKEMGISADRSFIDLLEEQAILTPSATAVIFEEVSLSYETLSKRSNQLAHYLRRSGVKRNMPVPICIERSAEMIIGILGILKAGAAYVPIDPTFPRERISFICSDTCAEVVVSSSLCLPLLQDAHITTLINLDEQQEAIIRESSLPLDELPTLQQLAYIIYTSGSTGTPKGAMITHGNLADYLSGLKASLPLDTCHSFALLSGISTDLGNTILYGALMTGGCLHVFSTEATRDSEWLQDYFKVHAIDCMKIVPSHWKALSSTEHMLLPRKLLIFGGEALDAEVVNNIHQSAATCKIVNHYGPTETTIGKLLHVVNDNAGYKFTVPIGKPFSNTCIYVLNQEMQLCPVGIPGELYIGGDGVGQGYLNNSDLTATCFVTDPFSGTNNTRFYRTGDMVKFLPDGNIVFIGRFDDQVKIRGYRVELAEIERVLEECGLVSQGVVVNRKDSDGTNHLAAYVTVHEETTQQNIISYLQQHLPDYMLPEALVILDELPLLANGKVNRKALPDATGTTFRKGYTAPGTATEHHLAEIWAQLLEVEQVGVYDNFFELGGHSLLAIRLVSAIRKRLKREVTISDVFDYPTIAALSTRVTALSERTGLQEIVAGNRPAYLPLSFSQERLWFIDQLEGSIHYHIPHVLQLKGNLDRGALSAALQAIVNRHEVLRTVIARQDDIAYQRILEESQWQLSIINEPIYRADPALLQSRIQLLLKQPFDLSRDHPLRAYLIALEENVHILVVILHHIASDAWSTGIIIRELISLYDTYTTGSEPSLQALPVQYADYAIWQRTYLSGNTLADKLNYWKHKLAGVATLQLPADYKKPVVQSIRGATSSFKLDKELSAQLQSLSLYQETTLFMTLLAGFKVLLYRYCNQDDICIGSPIAGRNRQETEGLIGFFINTLALRSDLKDNPSFVSLLQQVKTTTLGAYEHQDVPFEKVVEAVVKNRDLSVNPLFQVLFSLQNIPEEPDLRLGDVKLQTLSVAHVTAQFDIAVAMVESNDGISGNVVYCADVFHEETINRMMTHYVQLLKSIVSAPDAKIDSLEMLAPAEEHQLLKTFNDTARDYPLQKTLVGLFEQQATLSPDATAVIFEEKNLTYRELNEHANRLAHYLVNKGVKPGYLVPLCVERSLEMIVGILGILKAGAAYVPLDPTYPADRILFMLSDTGATLIVTSSEQATLLKDISPAAQVVLLDADWGIIEQEPSQDLNIKTAPDDLAYVIYTSGSTGTPKGVMNEHRGVVNRLLWAQDFFCLKQDDVVLQKTTFCFDVSVWELLWPLITGAKMVFALPEGQKDAVYLRNVINRYRVTMIHFVPSMLNAFLEIMEAGEKCSLHSVICSGEALQSQHIQDFQHKLPGVRLYNLYGPTEAAIDVTCWEVPAGYNTSDKVLIGKPVANTQLYILDGSGNIMPAGVAGELYIGGAQVARGYLNRGTLTDEKFIPDRFSNEQGRRLYKTGDLCQWLQDGNIEYLGRTDGQVKIRGYRIETGEIENVLLQYEWVSEAVVVAKPGEHPYLVAYIVPNGVFNKEGIFTWLQQKLPAYMIPALLQEMDHLPLTINGKIDRKALPEPGITADQQYVAPRNETEKVLAGIWISLLGIEQVSIYDNFFELGGDSIITIQVVSRAKRAGYEFHPRDLFIYQTISGLASFLKGKKNNTIYGEQGLLTGSSGLLPIQEAYFDAENTGTIHFNQSVLLGIDKRISAPVLSAVIAQLVQHHDALRFVYTAEDGNWTQTYGTAEGKLEITDLQQVLSDKLAETITIYGNDYQRSLDITKGGLMKAVLLLTPSYERYNRLLLVIHHLGVDGVSWRILLEDMQLLLQQAGASAADIPEHKTSSYRQWRQALEQYSQRKRLLKQKDYWQQVTQSYFPLRVDKPFTGKVTMADTGTYIIRLGSLQTGRLLKEAPLAYHTEINDILLSALALTLSEWNQQSDIVIGLEGHGREDIMPGIDTSRTIGWFSNMYPVLLQVKAGITKGELLKSTKEQLRKITDKGIGYGVLKYINKADFLQGNDPWDVVFNYLGQSDNVVGGTGYLTGVSESPGTTISADFPMRDKLRINSIIQDGELVLQWGYSNKHYEPGTVQHLAETYLSHLEAIILHCINQSQPAFTPSDYGLGAEVSNEDLDRFLDGSQYHFRNRDQIAGLYRLSHLQEGMLFHSLYNKQAGTFIRQLSCDLLNLDEKAFCKSWEHLLQQHSILRSAFYHNELNIPIQCVYRQVTLPVITLDYSRMDEAAQLEAIKAYEAADRSKGFDFREPPLVRISLIYLGGGHHRLLWTIHHIILDGWSQPVLVEELLNTYELLVSGKPIPTAPVDNYEDYIRYLERTDQELAAQYWQHYLEGISEGTLLPFIENNNNRNKGAGLYKEHELLLDAVYTAQLHHYARQQHITLNTLMQGVWAYLLYRYTNQTSIIYGVTVSGRPEDMSEVEQRVGMYINTLPLLARIEEDKSIAAFLQELQESQLQSRTYQYSGLSDIQQWTQIQGELMDTSITFQNFPVSEVINRKEWSLHVKDVQTHPRTNYPLTLVISVGATSRLLFSYNNDLLDTWYVERAGEHFKQVLTWIIENETGRLKDIELLTPEDRDYLLEVCNEQHMPVLADKPFLALFNEQVLMTPETAALVFEQESLSFRLLDERSNQLAKYLQQNGVGKGNLIPLCISTSPEMITGVLGILKSGAAYVPIDPDYPLEKISYILKDVGATVIVGDKYSKAKLSDVTAGMGFVSLDEDQDAIHRFSVLPVSDLPAPDDLIYVIYTSGSTGVPKGVMITHKNISDYLSGIKSAIGIDECSSFALMSGLSTDLGNTVIYSALAGGSTLHTFSKNTLSDAEALQLYFSTHTVDCIKIVPSHWKAISSGEKLLLPKRLLIFGGEVLPAAIIESIRLSGATCKVVNHYGPTETTIGKLLHVVNAANVYHHNVPIGKPFGNTRAYVLTPDLKIVPAGVPGELYISGAGVGMGYLHNESLTTDRFLNDPFSTDAATSMYRTGDIVKRLPDGNIVFIGRSDDQVKIHGYRVELEEISRILNRCEQVKQGVVIARPDARGDKQLIAYIVAADVFKREEIYNYLREQLPDYMVPSLLIDIPSFPLLANGKVDRKSLPDVENERQELAYAAPVTPLQKALARIWSSLLEVDKVGLHDDFFALGGHSLLAIRLISAIRKELEAEVSITDIFDYPTLSSLCTQLNRTSATISAPPLSAVTRPANIPLSFSQERLWFIDQLEGSVHYHIPHILQLKGKLNKEALSGALQSIVNRHEVMRTIITTAAGIPYQCIQETDAWQLQVVAAPELKDNEQALQSHVRALIVAPFDLSNDYMLRAHLIILEEEKYVLVVVLHHIASDGWSSGIIVRELAALYSALEENRPVELPQLPVQYADYALWQRNWLNEDVLAGKLDYWEEKLAGITTLQLPSDFIRPQVQSTRGAISHFTVSKALTDQLYQLSGAHGATLYMTLLAAFKILLHRYSSQEDIAVGIPVAGRTQQETEALVGFFVNTLVIRSDVSNDPSFVTLLQQVKNTTIAAYQHQEVPFEKIVEKIVKHRDLSTHPLFQVFFTLQNVPESPALHIGSLELSSVNVAHYSAQFDLNISLHENAGGIEGSVVYNADLFSAATITRMMNHYEQLLQSAAASPDAPIGSLDMLNETEVNELVVTFNNNGIAAAPETDQTIVSLFSAQVNRTPAAIALMYEDAGLTYKELDERACQLAHCLLEKGIQPETLVPVCIDRSPEMIVALLGILRAGAAYVPIDPDYPDERISYLLEDTAAPLMISSSAYAQRLQTITAAIDIVLMDDKTLNGYEKISPDIIVRANQLAYVIYTSGSTGKPKGVLVEHRNVVSLFSACSQLYDFNNEDVWTMFHSYCFDFSVWEMYGALFHGGRLLIVPGYMVRDTRLFGELLITGGVTVLSQTPAAFYVLQDYLVAQKKAHKIRYVIFGGEALNPSKTRPWQKAYDHCRLINMYGITETTVHVTYQPIGVEHVSNRSVIGKAIPGLSLYILDSGQRLLPAGAAGELYVGGPGVSRGYLNRQELTAERFIASPFSKDAGARLYRTGDLCRWLPDGTAEYMGRMDMQVKIRGYRIELGEIENALQQCEWVKEAVVLPVPDKVHLVSYIVPAGDFNPEAIRLYLKNKLPEYMLPALFIEMDQFPLTPNGKINKQALPLPASGTQLTNKYMAPRNERERALADIWQRILKVERIGIYDNFFEQGGHSLLAMRLIAEIDESLQVKISVKLLFQLETIESLARHIEISRNMLNPEKSEVKAVKL